MSIVLCIDRDARQRADVSNLLKRSGCSVVAVRDAWEALETFGAHHPDIALVLFDAGLQGMTGLQLVQHLSRIDAQVPVVVMSEPEADVAGYLDTKAVVAVLRKPLQSDELTAVLPPALQAGRVPTGWQPPAAEATTETMAETGAISDRFHWPPTAEELDGIQVLDTASHESDLAPARAASASASARAGAETTGDLIDLATAAEPAFMPASSPTVLGGFDTALVAPSPQQDADAARTFEERREVERSSIGLYPVFVTPVTDRTTLADATIATHAAPVAYAAPVARATHGADATRAAVRSARANRRAVRTSRRARAWMRAPRVRRLLATAAATACGVGITTYFEVRGDMPPLASFVPPAILNVAPLVSAPLPYALETLDARASDAQPGVGDTSVLRPVSTARVSTARVSTNRVSTTRMGAAAPAGTRRGARHGTNVRSVRRASVSGDAALSSPAVRTAGGSDEISLRLASCVSCDEEEETIALESDAARVAQPRLNRFASFMKKTPRAVAKPFTIVWQAIRGKNDNSQPVRAN